MQIVTILIAAAALMLWPLFTGIIAQTFGRKFWPWFGLGLVFPFLALVVLHCIPAKDRSYKTDSSSQRRKPYSYYP